MKNTAIYLLIMILLIAACSQDPEYYFDNSYSISGFDSNGIDPGESGDNYADFEENPFIKTSEQSVSTFSIDADGASYSNMRRFVMAEKQIPPKAALRTEELINYFNLDYLPPAGSHPIGLNGEVSQCPWNEDHKLIRIGIKGKHIARNQLPPSNFVFLIDVSGSMKNTDKLDLLKEGFKTLTDELSDQDRIAIVTYAGQAGVLLESTSGSNKTRIKNAIDQLGAGGSTAGAQGIITAYEIADQNFIEGGNNRVILGSDGDFNVGISKTEDLVKLIEEKRESGIFLTVLGVGRGNLNDAMMEQLANNGNGNYEYLDKAEQLEKVFIHEYSKFFTVAKDVKVQVTFNPDLVKEYRLIGYENRLLEEEDFENDTKDAGEIGADQSITALYEIVPVTTGDFHSKSTFTINFRYKLPDSDTSIPIDLAIFDTGNSFEQASDYLQLTASIASFSMLMRDSKHKGSTSYKKIENWLETVDLKDEFGYISELKKIVDQASKIK